MTFNLDINTKWRNSPHLSRFPHSDIDTYRALCSQQEASIATVWLENSRRLVFLLNLFRNGHRQLIPITHSIPTQKLTWILRWMKCSPERVCMQMTRISISPMRQRGPSAHTMQRTIYRRTRFEFSFFFVRFKNNTHLSVIFPFILLNQRQVLFLIEKKTYIPYPWGSSAVILVTVVDMHPRLTVSTNILPRYCSLLLFQ